MKLKFKKLSKDQQRTIKGGYRKLAECVKDCGGGKTVTCTGETCGTTEKGCVDNSSDPFSYKPCPVD